MEVLSWFFTLKAKPLWSCVGKIQCIEPDFGKLLGIDVLIDFFVVWKVQCLEEGFDSDETLSSTFSLFNKLKLIVIDDR